MINHHSGSSEKYLIAFPIEPVDNGAGKISLDLSLTNSIDI